MLKKIKASLLNTISSIINDNEKFYWSPDANSIVAFLTFSTLFYYILKYLLTAWAFSSINVSVTAKMFLDYNSAQIDGYNLHLTVFFISFLFTLPLYSFRPSLSGNQKSKVLAYSLLIIFFLICALLLIVLMTFIELKLLPSLRIISVIIIFLITLNAIYILRTTAIIKFISIYVAVTIALIISLKYISDQRTDKSKNNNVYIYYNNDASGSKEGAIIASFKDYILFRNSSDELLIPMNSIRKIVLKTEQ